MQTDRSYKGQPRRYDTYRHIHQDVPWYLWWYPGKAGGRLKVIDCHCVLYDWVMKGLVEGPKSHLVTVWTLTHWGRVTHICVSKITIIGSDNGLSPDRRQAIIWTNAGILLIGPLGTNFSEILFEILTFSFKKMRLKVSSAKRRPFCLGLNVLTHWPMGDVMYYFKFLQCSNTFYELTSKSFRAIHHWVNVVRRRHLR